MKLGLPERCPLRGARQRHGPVDQLALILELAVGPEQGQARPVMAAKLRQGLALAGADAHPEHGQPAEQATERAESGRQPGGVDQRRRARQRGGDRMRRLTQFCATSGT